MFKRVKEYLKWHVDIYKDGLRFRELGKKHGDVVDKLDSADRLREVSSNLEMQLSDSLRAYDNLRAEIRFFKSRIEGYERELEGFKADKHEIRSRSVTFHDANLAYTQAERFWQGLISSYRAAMFRGGVDCVLVKPDFQKIPMIYFDNVNRDLIFTEAAQNYLGLEELPKKSSAFKLLSCISREYRTDIIDSIKSGKKLRHFNCKTVDGHDLKLGVEYFSYRKKVFGVRINLYDPLVSLDRQRFGLARAFESVRKKLTDGFWSIDLKNRDSPFPTI